MITIGQLWQYPVKSMQGELVDQVTFGPGGAIGDRAYGFLDVASNRLVSCKHPHRYKDMFQCYATFVKPPQAGEPAPPVRVTFPDGDSIEGDNDAIAKKVSELLGREVRMVTSVPEGVGYEEIWPEMEGFGPDEFYSVLQVEPSDNDPSGERIVLIPPGLAAAGTLLDLSALHILASPSLAAMAAAHPDGQWDARRFRPNILFDVEVTGPAPAPSEVEDGWIGHELVVPSSGTRLAVTAHTPRCVMITLAQPGLERDPKILQTTARSNQQRLATLGGTFASMGAYAEVVTPGLIRTGDPVEVATDNLADSSELAKCIAKVEELITAAGSAGGVVAGRAGQSGDA